MSVEQILKTWKQAVKSNPFAILNLVGLNLTKLPTLPSNLKVLDCSDNKLTSLDNLPDLTELYCSKNRLSEIPQIKSLIALKCDRNELTFLRILSKLQYLSCYKNNLTELEFAIGLKYLNCAHNKLTNLTNISDVLTLKCSHNELTSMQPMHRVRLIDCSQNQIQRLPTFPKTLTTLLCDENRLEQLPHLSSVSWLSCEGNLLMELSDLPVAVSVSCSNNYIKTVGQMPIVKSLYCSNNQIRSLPTLSLTRHLECSGNEGIVLSLGMINLQYLQINKNGFLPTDLRGLKVSKNDIISKLMTSYTFTIPHIKGIVTSYKDPDPPLIDHSTLVIVNDETSYSRSIGHLFENRLIKYLSGSQEKSKKLFKWSESLADRNIIKPTARIFRLPGINAFIDLSGWDKLETSTNLALVQCEEEINYGSFHKMFEDTAKLYTLCNLQTDCK